VLNILVACKGERTPGGLFDLGVDWVAHYDSTPGWANAANQLLDRAAALGGDALFCDDDVTFTADSLAGVQAHYDAADLFGLDLHALDGVRQSGARHTMTTQGMIYDWVYPGPAYVAHVSTSAIYIKAAAVRALRFPVWPGVHWEDVAFCLDAWLSGFKVMAVPGLVHHAIEGGIGATKRHDPRFWERWRQNMDAMTAWMNERGVLGALADGRIPVGVRAIEEVVSG
jgi:GT2 family glycosyltransferase